MVLGVMKEMLSNTDIYEIVKSEILNFSVPPASYISESELTKRFDVSRTPIREVLKKLEYDGLVKIIPNKATQVTAIDFKSILNFMYIREKLEVGLIEDLIAVIANDVMINQEIISQLTLIIAKQNKIINSDTEILEKANTFFDLDNEFHKCIFSALNKAELWSYTMTLQPDYVRFRTMVNEFYSQNDLKTLLTQHQQIIELIKEKDVTTLKKVYKQHIHGGVSLFQKIIAEKENYFI